jgi:hypothetical protein
LIREKVLSGLIAQFADYTPAVIASSSDGLAIPAGNCETA